MLASLDIGSNTIRLLIGTIEDDTIHDVLYLRHITRLGSGLSQKGRLHDHSIEVSRAVLREYAALLNTYKVQHSKAVATSALREATNADYFIERVLADTGISIEIISGEKEANLILKGVLLSISVSPNFKNHPYLIIDIGGGSTERILFRDQSLIDMRSYPIGVIKLAERFIHTDPVSEADFEQLTKEITSYVEILRENLRNHVGTIRRIIGTAGTFTTIASIDLGLITYSHEKIHLHEITLKRLQDMMKHLLSLPLNERKKVKGLEPDRADLIIPGLQFTIKLMDYLSFDELWISDHGLLEGVLIELYEETGGKGISKTDKP